MAAGRTMVGQREFLLFVEARFLRNDDELLSTVTIGAAEPDRLVGDIGAHREGGRD